MLSAVKTKIPLNFSNIEIFILSVALSIGVMCLFIPAHYLLILFVSGLVAALLVAKPEIPYYLLILSLPIAFFRFSTGGLNIGFLDIFIFISLVSIFLHSIIFNKFVSLKTTADKYVIVLSVLFLFAGLTSISSTGILGAMKFIEAVIVYYLTVYLLRLKYIKISDILKLFIVSACFQAAVGIFQSATGLGTFYRTNRGYLGLLGLGSTSVWHGQGSFIHFNGFGNYLVSMFLLLCPFLHYVLKNKKIALAIALLLFSGVIISYSRGSLLGLIVAMTFFMHEITSNKMKFWISAVTGFLFIGAFAVYVSGTSYINTLNPRDNIWDVVFAIIFDGPRSTLIGSGLNSYWDAIALYIPANVTFERISGWYAHSSYLLAMQEMGLIGLFIYYGIIGCFMFSLYRDYRITNGYLKLLSLSILMFLIGMLIMGIFDHSFASTNFRTLIFVIFALYYAFRNKEKIFNKISGKQVDLAEATYVK